MDAELSREASFEGMVNSGFVFDRKQEEDRLLTAVRRGGIRICATEQETRRPHEDAATAGRVLGQLTD